jgi:hypothetical protein
LDIRRKIAGWSKLMATLIALSATLTLGFAPRAYGDDDRAECQHRIRKAEAKLDAAIRKHGEHSAQADTRRTELKAQRERCYNRVRAWWNEHERKWHEDRDWDRDDRH